MPVTDEQRAELERMARRRRCRIGRWCRRRVVVAADGVANEEIARRVGWTRDTVRRWRRRFAEQGVAGVGVIAQGSGPQVVAAAGHGRGGGAADTPGAARLTGRRTGRRGRWPPGRGRQGHGGRIWADHDLKPWKVDTFKVSNDPRFEEKLVDVVGLYLNPPAAGGGVQLRREDPVPGAGPHPAVAADEAGPGRDDDP